MELKQAVKIQSYLENTEANEERAAVTVESGDKSVRPSTHELFERLRALYMDLQTFAPAGSSPISYTPQLAPGPNGPYLKFSVFTPAAGDLNTPEICAYWTRFPDDFSGPTPPHGRKNIAIEDVKLGTFVYGSTEMQNKAIIKLGELEKSYQAYEQMALGLSPQEAKEKGFSVEFMELLDEEQQKR